MRVTPEIRLRILRILLVVPERPVIEPPINDANDDVSRKRFSRNHTFQSWGLSNLDSLTGMFHGGRAEGVMFQKERLYPEILDINKQLYKKGRDIPRNDNAFVAIFTELDLEDMIIDWGMTPTFSEVWGWDVSSVAPVISIRVDLAKILRTAYDRRLHQMWYGLCSTYIFDSQDIRIVDIILMQAADTFKMSQGRCRVTVDPRRPRKCPYRGPKLLTTFIDHLLPRLNHVIDLIEIPWSSTVKASADSRLYNANIDNALLSLVSRKFVSAAAPLINGSREWSARTVSKLVDDVWCKSAREAVRIGSGPGADHIAESSRIWVLLRDATNYIGLDSGSPAMAPVTKRQGLVL